MIMVKQLLDHCSRSFDCRGELYQSEEADVLIAVYPATRKRGWWTYVTLELHKTGSVECVLYSYQFEPRMITHLAKVATQVIRQWEEQRVRLQTGGVFPLDGPISKRSSLDYLLATPVDFEEVGFDYFTNGNDVVRMMMLHAIAESEAVIVARQDVSRPPAI